MKLRVLGCSGGIGAQVRTTSFLFDDDILIDAGTGVEDLTVDELARIDHVFLTPNFTVEEAWYVPSPDSVTDHPAHWATVTWE